MSSDMNNERRPAAPKIAEDGPVMRSVAMMSPPSMSPIDSFQRLSLQRDKPIVYQNNALVKPAVAFSEKVAPNVEDTPWKVVRALPLPPNYQLDRSHIRISDTSSLEVSRRLADHLFRQSISATFDNEKSLAVGTTATCLKFHIRIWDASGEVVVEVQRYAGCGIDFQFTVKDIFSVAKSGQPSSSRFGSLSMPRSLPKLPDSVWAESTNEALDIAISSLQSNNRIDSQSLAMESLAQLSSSENCRVFCAKAILSSDSELLPLIVSLINREDFSARNASEESAGGLEDCYRLMRREAVNTLANCLESITTQVDKFEFERVASLSNTTTLSVLVHDIASAERCPHDAAASCRCLHHFCQCSDGIKQAVMELGVSGHVANASKCRHIMLQQESLRLLQIL